MKPEEQRNGYECGVYCVHFLLGLFGIKAMLPDALAEIMGTTEEDGTSHEGIKKGFKHYGLKWVAWDDAHISTLQEFLPAIINYQYCDEDGCDGHYAVVLGQGHGFFVIYNPATGDIEMLDEKYLSKNWYSKRYGKGWLIQPVKNVNNGYES
jgi:ABC-type bacteriocin/lantibiotic exporter with double-glycine peptidase domain